MTVASITRLSISQYREDANGRAGKVLPHMLRVCAGAADHSYSLEYVEGSFLSTFHMCGLNLKRLTHFPRNCRKLAT